MRILTIALLASATASASVALTETTAHACGGCFVPPNEVTAVDSHRMVIAIGQTETVLWDQIVYSGAPEEFVWVLPIPTPDVLVELADNQFFDDLDRQTAPVIQPLSPPPFCPQSNSAACGSSDTLADGGGYTPTDGVTVYDHSVVGPYETVTLGAENPDALYTWLGDNNFAVTEEAIPAMEYYIGLEHAFVIMRLQPGQDVSAMQPVRVRYPGFMGTFPLRMVVVGAQGVLDLALWVVAEQRYDAQNYGTVTIDESRLTWDWNTNLSNYSELFDATVEENGNRAWVAEFAGPLGVLGLGGEDADILWNTGSAPYVTRLRTRMLVDHIDQDMVLGPSESVGDIDNFLFAPIDLNYPENPCGSSADDDSLYCTLGMGSGKDAAFLGLVMICGLALVLRRRRTHAR